METFDSEERLLANRPRNQQDETLKGEITGPGLGFSLDEAYGDREDASGGEGGFAGDSEKRENKQDYEFGVDGGRKAVHGLGFLLRAEKSDEFGIVKKALGVRCEEGTGSGFNKEAEFESNGISPLFDAHDSIVSVEREPKLEIEVANRSHLRKKSGTEDGDPNLSRNGNTAVSKTYPMSDDGVGEEAVMDDDCPFSVGDFVWGKMRSHPWWPGRIYNPSDASDNGSKYSRRDRRLVAYFGDCSFSWCYPSQLEPFQEKYESLSKQSDSRNFLNAVEAAVDEIGRLVELEMTCSCMLKENQLSLACPFVANSGINRGVLKPRGGLGKHSVAHYEPAELIADLKSVAQTVNPKNALELTVLKSRLSAFYQAKGGYRLPAYCVPQSIIGLEDKNRIDNDRSTNVPIEGPLVEECVSSPTGPLNISEDKLYQRRKQKSMVEILEEATDFEANGKLGTDNGGVEIQNGYGLTSPLRRGRSKKTRHMGSFIITDYHGYCEENGGSGEKVELKRCPTLRGRKRKGSEVKNAGGETMGTGNSTYKNSNSEIEDGGKLDDATRESQKGLVSRERKKSKYLSPPYTTNLKQWPDYSISKMDSETGSLHVSDFSRSGKFQKPSNEHVVSCDDAMGSPSSQVKKQVPEMIIDVKETRASPNEVLSELQSAAVDLQNSKDMVKRFLSMFRSSIYREGSNYKAYHKSRRGRKRRSLHPQLGSVGRPLDQTESHSHRGKVSKLDVSKLKRAPVMASELKSDDNADGLLSSSSVVFVTFPPVVSLPSKDELVKIYRKFGPLNLTETDMIYNSFCGRVVFVRTADAERAFNDSVKNSPFGAAKVSFRLKYPSAPPRTNEVTEDFRTKASSLSNEGSIELGNSSAKEALQLNFIKEKLEMMTSMLESSDGNMSPEMKSNVVGEMKILLEEVSAMIKSF